MKSVVRFGTLVMLIAGVLTPALGAQAQAQKPCWTLADADCQLFYGALSSDNLSKLTSFVLNYSVTGKATGTPQGDVNFNLIGGGPIGLGEAVIAALKQGAQMSNAQGALQAIQLMDSFRVTAKSPKQPFNLSGEVRITGGKLYWMSKEKTGGKWKVMDLTTAASSNPSLGILGGGANSSASSNAMQNPQIQADMQAFSKYVKVNADAGPSVDGAPTRRFTFDVDLGGMLSGPEFQKLMTDATSSAGPATQSAESANLGKAMVQMYVGLIQSVFKNSRFQIKFLAGSNDKLLHGFDLSFSLKVDAATLNQLQSMGGSLTGSMGSGSADMGTSAPIASPTPFTSDINVNFDLNLRLSKIGQTVKVDPVPNAIAVTPAATESQ